MAAFGPQTEFHPVLHNMVSDYVFHKIRQRQFNYLMQRSLCGKAICPPEFASLAIKFLGDEVTVECNRKFKQALSTAAADHIIAEHGELFSDEVYEKGFRVSLETIPSLVNEMGDMIFKEKQNMGTVAAFLAFGAMFSAYCEQKEGFGVQVVKAIVTSVAKHLDDNLGSWLKTNGGLRMVLSAKTECLNHVTASRQRKVQFANSLKLVAEHNFQTTNPQSYREMCELVLGLQNLLGMKEKMPETYFDYAMFLFSQGIYSGAVDALENALQGFHSNSSTPFVGQCYFQMGVISCHLEQFPKALNSFEKALGCKQILAGNRNMSTAICQHWLGYVHRRLENMEKAFEAQTKVLQELEQSTVDMTGRTFISDSCFELGCIYYAKGDLRNAIEFHQRALVMREEEAAGFKRKLQSYLHLAKVLVDRERKMPQLCNEHPKSPVKIGNLLDRALTLCKEQYQYGNLRDTFPFIMIAHTYRLESIKGLLLLGLELCARLATMLAEENIEEKPKSEQQKSEFQKLLQIFLDEGGMVETVYKNSRDDGAAAPQGPGEQENGHEQVVPPEINLRGHLAVEAYNKALAEGKTCVRRVPVMLIGQDRCGKTSLKKSLRGVPFDPNEGSTKGIDCDPSYFKVTTEMWKAGEKDQARNTDAATSYEHHAARMVVKKLRERECDVEEGAVETRQPENVPFVAPAVSPNVDMSSAYAGVSSKESSANVSDIASIPTNVTEAVKNETSQGSTESLQASRVPYSDNDNRVFNTSDDQRSDPIRTEKDDESLLASPRIPDEIETLIKKLLLEVDKVEGEDDIYSNLWDFGGQSIYYVTHPIFLTPRAMYVLVYDLSRGLHETAHPLIKQGMFKRIEDSFGAKSNLDYLDFWMTSVASLSSEDEDYTVHEDPNSKVLPEKLPPVFLVCTHSDEPYGGEDPAVLALEVFGSLQTKAFKSHLFDDVFVVDNTKSGREAECTNVARLREKILAAAKELPQLKKDVPIKWLKFEKALQVTREDGHKWISFERARQIASEVCRIDDEQEFVTSLNFMHDQRILIHFGDTAELNKLVVLDPQWLIDVFKKVITVKSYDFQDKQSHDLWHKLETTGILEEALVQHVWGPLLDHQDTIDSLIAVMEKFSLLCPWPSSDTSNNKQYLVPSMLMSHPTQDIFKLVTSAKLPSLLLKFETGQVPPGLFPRLMLQLFQWGREEFWSSVNPQLFQNFARFYTSGDDECSVILLCHSSSIEVVVHRGNRSPELVEGAQSKLTMTADGHHDAFELTCARALHRQLGLMLECMRREFCWMKKMRYTMGVVCPVCCPGVVVKYCRTHHVQYCQREECLHFWSESELRSASQSVICTRSAVAVTNKFQVKRFAPWFPFLAEQKTADELDGKFLPSRVGDERKSLALPGKVVESLSHSPDPKEVVLQLKETLHLDQTSLKHPEPETKQLIRCLAKRAKHSNRLDVVRHLREITPAGTTGPLLPGNLDIQNVPVRQMRDLTIDLSGREEWKVVAERLGLPPKEIRYLDMRTLNPCDAALAVISQRCSINVEDLYDVLNECGLPVVADTL